MNDHSGKEDSCFKKIVKSAICLCRLAHRIKNNWCCAICFILITLLIICCWNLCSDVQSLTETTNALKVTIKKSGVIFSSHSADLEIKHLKERLDTLTDYQSSILTWIGIITTIVTVVVAACGILAPFLINRGYEKKLDKQVKDATEESKQKFAAQTAEIQQKIIANTNTTNKLVRIIEGYELKAKINAIKSKLSYDALRASQESDLNNRINSLHEVIRECNISIDEFDIYIQQSANKHDTEINNYLKSTVDEMIVFCAKVLVDLGKYYGELGDYEKVVKYSRDALELQENLPMAYNNLGNALFELNDIEESIKMCTIAIQLAPKLAMCYVNRARAYDEKALIQEALEDLYTAIKLDPTLSMAYNNRGIIYANQGLIDLAISDYKKAIQLEPELLLPYMNIAELYMSKNNYDSAIQELTEFLTINSKNIDVLAMRGVCYRSKNEYGRAIEDFTNAISMEPTKESLYIKRASVYLDTDNYDQAAYDLEHSLLLNRDLSAAYLLYGILKLRQHLYEEALNYFQVSLELANNHFEKIQVHENIIELYESMIQNDQNDTKSNRYTELIADHKKIITELMQY